LKDVLSNRASCSNSSTPQLSIDSFDRCEDIKDTSTSKKPDLICSTPEAMQSGNEIPSAKRKWPLDAKEGKAASKDEQSLTMSLDSAVSKYNANQSDKEKNV